MTMNSPAMLPSRSAVASSLYEGFLLVLLQHGEVREASRILQDIVLHDPDREVQFTEVWGELIRLPESDEERAMQLAMLETMLQSGYRMPVAEDISAVLKDGNAPAIALLLKYDCGMLNDAAGFWMHDVLKSGQVALAACIMNAGITMTGYPVNVAKALIVENSGNKYTTLSESSVETVRFMIERRLLTTDPDDYYHQSFSFESVKELYSTGRIMPPDLTEWFAQFAVKEGFAEEAWECASKGVRVSMASALADAGVDTLEICQQGYGMGFSRGHFSRMVDHFNADIFITYTLPKMVHMRPEFYDSVQLYSWMRCLEMGLYRELVVDSGDLFYLIDRILEKIEEDVVIEEQYAKCFSEILGLVYNTPTLLRHTLSKSKYVTGSSVYGLNSMFSALCKYESLQVVGGVLCMCMSSPQLWKDHPPAYGERLAAALVTIFHEQTKRSDIPALFANLRVRGVAEKILQSVRDLQPAKWHAEHIVGSLHGKAPDRDTAVAVMCFALCDDAVRVRIINEATTILMEEDDKQVKVLSDLSFWGMCPPFDMMQLGGLSDSARAALLVAIGE